MRYLTLLIIVGIVAGTVVCLLAAGEVASPVISPGGGTYDSPVTVSMTTSTKGAEIRYTLDGSVPTKKSSRYSTPFVLVASAAVQAMAFKSGMLASMLARAELTIGLPSLLRLVWEDNSDGEVAFEVRRKSGIEQGFVVAGQAVADSTEYSDTTVRGGNNYCYIVRALDSSGWSSSRWSNEACALAP
jgi:hypothetical protein